MAIPENPVTGSLPSSTPAAECGQGVDEEKARLSASTPRPSSEWEEPHPGQRYSYTVAVNARLGVGTTCLQHCNGVNRVAMAAKAYAPYPSRSWPPGAVRRFSRPRLRIQPPRPLRILAGTPTSVSVNSNTSSTAPMLALPKGPQAPATQRASATPAISPMYSYQPAGRVAEAQSSSEGCSVRLSLTDFSGFLKADAGTGAGLRTGTAGIAAAAAANEDSDGDSSFMSLDTDSLPYATTRLLPPPLSSPEEVVDPYGWEAELDRKVHATVRECCACPSLHLRNKAAGGGGPKRTLLQKVLSLGPRDLMLGRGGRMS